MEEYVFDFNNTGLWNNNEKEKFIFSLFEYDGDFDLMEKHIFTRTKIQIRNQAARFYHIFEFNIHSELERLNETKEYFKIEYFFVLEYLNILLDKYLFYCDNDRFKMIIKDLETCWVFYSFDYQFDLYGFCRFNYVYENDNEDISSIKYIDDFDLKDPWGQDLMELFNLK